MSPGAQGGDWWNWARNVRAKPLSWEAPTSSDELAKAVRAARAAGTRVKVVGSGHSCSEIASPEGARLVSMERFSGVIAVDPERRFVTFGGGTTLASVNGALAARGLALPSLGSISEQTVAGAISTGTHGSSLRYGGLAEQVEGLEMVQADGALVTVNRTENPDLFDAARVGVGALGVITQVTLRCVKAFDLVATAKPVRFDETLANLGRLAREHEHSRIWWFPHTGWTQTWTAEAVPPSNEGSGNSSDEADRSRGTGGERLLELLYGITRPVPLLVGPANRLLRRVLFDSGSRTSGRSDRVFNFPISVRQRVMEHAIPLEKATEAIVALRDLIGHRGFQAHLPVEIRFSAPETSWLALAHGRPTCYIGVIAYRPFGMEPKHESYFRAVDDLMAGFGGRPHWAKLHYRGPAQLAPLYPEWDRFIRLRDRLDPTGVFANRYLDSVLGGRSS